VLSHAVIWIARGFPNRIQRCTCGTAIRNEAYHHAKLYFFSLRKVPDVSSYLPFL